MSTRTFNVAVPIASAPGQPMWTNYTIHADTASMAREMGVIAAEDEGYSIDEGDPWRQACHGQLDGLTERVDNDTRRVDTKNMQTEAQATAENIANRDHNGVWIWKGDRVRKLGQHPAVNSYRVQGVSGGIVTLETGGSTFTEHAKYVTVVSKAD